MTVTAPERLEVDARAHPPIVEFYSLFPSAKAPERASQDLVGSMPVRAVQRCAPLVAASGFGYYVYSPFDFALRWDGQETFLAYLEDGEPGPWISLAGNACPLIPTEKEILGALPAERRAALAETGADKLHLINCDPREMSLFEMTPGIVARTAPGWSLLVRPVPNLRPIAGMRVLEGILESSWYRNFVPVTGRLTEAGRVVRFYRNYPLACLQPIPDIAYQPSTLDRFTVATGFDAMPDDVFAELIDNLERREKQPAGSYRAESRRRARVND